MRIANPMYDAAFKYLMDDDASARLLVGAVLGEEIESLDPLPQERSVRASPPPVPGEPTPAELFTVRRVDFAATVRTASGDRLRVLDEVQECLPHTTAAVLRTVREYLDGITDRRLADREEFVEALSHDCWVAQVPLLASRRRTDLECLLSVFDQERQVAGERGVLEIPYERM